MTKIKVAINGFGRIGRITYRLLRKNKNIDVVAVNDLTDATTLTHLLRFDSNHGQYGKKVSCTDSSITVDGDRFHLLSEKDPAKLPWKKMKIDVVVESTGRFRTKEAAGLHLKAGAKKVVLSAPAKGDSIPTVVLGVNEGILTGKEKIISNASCTTNCLAPMAKILNDAYGIERGFLTTIHAYTSDQRLQDAPHRDLRRARAAARSIIPTSTGAAETLGIVLPELKGKLDGMAARVPVSDGSLTDLVVELSQKVSIKEVNALFEKAAKGKYKKVLSYSIDPLVSQDIVGNPNSCIFDSLLTNVNGSMVKIVGWYDNEYGYSARTAQLVGMIG